MPPLSYYPTICIAAVETIIIMFECVNNNSINKILEHRHQSPSMATSQLDFVHMAIDTARQYLYTSWNRSAVVESA
jgi:hypothetical protein